MMPKNGYQELEDASGETQEGEEDEGLPNKEVSIFMLIGLNSYMFAYGMMVSTMGLIVLPLEASILFEDNHAFMLGVMLGVTGITQLISPLTGYLSDRCTSSLGRRRPFLIVGMILSLMGLSAMFYSREILVGDMYLLSLVPTIVGINVYYAGYTALLPDFVPQSQRGQASGAMAALGLLGASVGFALLGFAIDVKWAYLLYGGTSFLASIITFSVANERPLLRDDARSITCMEILESYTINRTTHNDFFWVFVIRTLYYMALSVQAFILFYFRDVVKVDNPAYYTAIVALIGQVGACVISYPAGQLSDRPTIGRKPLVLIACLVMGIVYVLFLLFPDVKAILVVAFFYGFGNGTFISVDYALALDTLPSSKNRARDLGMWGVSAFVGTMLGGLIGGSLLNFVGGSDNEQSHNYTYTGYVVVMASGTVYLLGCIICLKFIRKAK